MKNSYILLRNNIESASLNIEELQDIGLTSSDLIWVECQSVYWQSPMEITELKALVGSTNKQISENKLETANESQSQHRKTSSAKNITSQSVFVELPAQEKIGENNGRSNPKHDSAINILKKYGNPENEDNLNLVKNFSGTKKYPDQPFDEINKTPIKESGEKSNLEKTVFGFELPRNVKKIALYSGLVATGAILMLLIMNKDIKNKIVLQPVLQHPQKVISTSELVTTETEETTTPLPESFEQESLPANETPDLKTDVQKLPVIQKRNIPVKKIEENNIEPSSNTSKNEKITKPATEIKEIKKVSAENVLSKLKLEANDYNVGSFGGIRNLEMTLHNNSITFLNKVTVEIQYLNPENDIVKKATIYFQSIAPGSTATIPVKKTNRGVKIDYKVINIESKETASRIPKSEESNTYSRN